MKAKLVRRIEIEMSESELEVMMHSLENTGQNNDYHGKQASYMHQQLNACLRDDPES